MAKAEALGRFAESRIASRLNQRWILPLWLWLPR
jgi:hypothetical protein